MAKDPRYFRGTPYFSQRAPLKPVRLLKNPTLSSLLSRICEEAGVIVRRGRGNRRILHLTDVLPLLRYLGEQYRPVRSLGFDRVSLVVWLSGLENELELFEGDRRPTSKAGYGWRLEMEIHRISKLAQPARTIAAVEFLRRIREARAVVKAGREYLKEDYGDAAETRYEGGAQWWRKLEQLAGMARPVDAQSPDRLPPSGAGDPSISSSSSSSSSS